MPVSDPLELLARTDKWQPSAGEGLVFAPPFPVWLDVLGFWDEAHPRGRMGEAIEVAL